MGNDEKNLTSNSTTNNKNDFKEFLNDTDSFKFYKKSMDQSTKTTTERTKKETNVFNQNNVPLVRLTKDILSPQRYDVRVRPVFNHQKSLKIHISMSLYQIIDVVGCFFKFNIKCFFFAE